MLRSFLVVLGAILLSVVFMAIEGLWFATSPGMAMMMWIASGAPFTENDVIELYKVMDRNLFIMQWITSPLTATVIGLFVGFFARKYPVRLAMLGITPYAVTSSGFSLTEIAFSVGYVLIAGGIAAIVFTVRQKTKQMDRLWH